jgi:hypothetical protein
MNPIAVGLKTSVIPKKGGGETLMFEGQLVNAIITNSKKLNGRLIFDLSGEGANTVCVVRGTVKGEADERTVTVGMPKTQNSPLWTGNQGDKEQQLTYLAARVWCRRHLPEVLLGVYTPEDDWTERDPDAVSQRADAVRSQVHALENMTPAPAALDPSKVDDFIEGDAVPVVIGVDLAKPGSDKTYKGTDHNDRMTNYGAADEGNPNLLFDGKTKTGRMITDAPEDRKPDGLADILDEPIPDFGAKCGTCDGKKSVPFTETDPDTGQVTAEGIEPCPDCGPQQPPTKGSTENEQEKH